MERSIVKNWIFSGCLMGIVITAIVMTVYVVTGFLGAMKLTQVHHNLKWVGLALHQYHDAYGTFPPVVLRDQNGNATHSWRALIEPEMDLDKQDMTNYRFSEPWNSPHNSRAEKSQVLRKQPFRFLAIVGPNASWSESGVHKLSDFMDGNSDTAMVIAVRDVDVPWYEPVDLTVSESGDLLLRGEPLSTANVFILTADGSVRYSKEPFPPELLTIAAGDDVPEW